MILGISGRARHGKTSAGVALAARCGVKCIGFADPIKTIVGAVFGWTPEYIEDNKETVDARGVSPRVAMQSLGTEWGRKLYREVWVDMGVRRALALDGNVAFVDVRFRSEVAAILRAGGRVLRIERQGLPRLDHQSEAELDDYYFEHTIANDGTLQELGNAAVAWFEALR